MAKVEASVARQFPNLIGDPKAMKEKCAKQVMLIQQGPEAWFEMNWGYKTADLNKHFGVLSLTPHPDNYLMWSHYANSHTGFCVEFDTRKLVESIAGHFQQVIYTDEVPIISINDALEDDLLGKLVYSKSKMWAYEDEYRLSQIHKPDTPIKFADEALTGIYYGCKITVEDEMEIIDIVSKKYPHACYYKMSLDKEHFKLLVG